MVRVGLTGGIGSGKSAVAQLLRARGAVLVDGDQVAREIVEPGQPALAAIAERFGTAVLRRDGSLDRAALAAIVFADPASLAALDAIMHPRIAGRSSELMRAAERAGAEVVVYDMPLLVEGGAAGQFDVVVVVQAPVEVRLRRLEARGLERADSLARMARQASDEQRLAVADLVLDNSGDRSALEAQVSAAWPRIVAAQGRRRRSPGGTEDRGGGDPGGSATPSPVSDP